MTNKDLQLFRLWPPPRGWKRPPTFPARAESWPWNDPDDLGFSEISFAYFAFQRNICPVAATVQPHEIFRALAHEARVRVVRELSDGGEKCVCDLVAACGLGWSTVSRHLSVLREAGVIADEKRGLQVFYRLTLPCVTNFIRCLEKPARYPEFQQTACCR